MNILLRWRRAVGRLCAFLWSVVVSVVRLLVVVVPQFIYLLLLQELVWKWWLGYGERPFRILSVIAIVLVSTWLLYWQLGTFVLEPGSMPLVIGQLSWQDALYYSLASFSALGYGNWVSEPVGWARWVGAVQPFIGIVSAVALSIALTQRITR